MHLEYMFNLMQSAHFLTKYVDDILHGNRYIIWIFHHSWRCSCT